MRKRKSNESSTKNFGTIGAPNFDSVPIPTLCQSIQMIMDNMASRGFPVRDFDHKDKVVKQVGMIGGKVYFLATKEETNDTTT